MMIASTPPRALLDERLRAARAALAARDLDAVVVAGDANRGWLSGYTVGIFVAPFGAIVLTREHATFVVRPVDYEDCRASVEHLDVVGLDLAREEMPDCVARLLREQGARRVLIEAPYATVAAAGHDRRVLEAAGLEVELGASLIAPLRAIKDAWEVAQLRGANVANRAVFDAICEQVRPGISEWDLAVALEHHVRLHGAGTTQTRFGVIVASGPNSSKPHAIPSQRRLERGDLLKLDFGVTFHGYGSDVARTVTVGPAADWQRELHAAVLAAQLDALAAIAPGVEAAHVHAVAAGVLDARGFGERFVHSVGHGLGIEPPEGILLHARSADVLRAGQVVAIEPGAYLPGRGGVRIEDDVLVTETGREVLTDIRKDLLELG